MFVTVSVPGRIEVLGNHTDYNGGRVLVAPTRKVVTVRMQSTAERRVTVASAEFSEVVSQTLPGIRRETGRRRGRIMCLAPCASVWRPGRGGAACGSRWAAICRLAPGSRVPPRSAWRRCARLHGFPGAAHRLR